LELYDQPSMDLQKKGESVIELQNKPFNITILPRDTGDDFRTSDWQTYIILNIYMANDVKTNASADGIRGAPTLNRIPPASIQSP